MTRSEYNALDMDGKMMAIKEHGQPMYIVSKENKKFLLYSMGNFFTEIAYDGRTNDVLSLATLINGPELDKYSELKNEILDKENYHTAIDKDIYEVFKDLLGQLKNKSISPDHAKVLFDLKSKEWNLYTNKIAELDFDGLPEYIDTNDLEGLKTRLLATQFIMEEIWSELKKQLYGSK